MSLCMTISDVRTTTTTTDLSFPTMKPQPPPRLHQFAKEIKALAKALSTLSHRPPFDPSSLSQKTCNLLAQTSNPPVTDEDFITIPTTHETETKTMTKIESNTEIETILTNLETALFTIQNTTANWNDEEWSQNHDLTRSLQRAYRAMERHRRICGLCLDEGAGEPDGGGGSGCVIDNDVGLLGVRDGQRWVRGVGIHDDGALEASGSIGGGKGWYAPEAPNVSAM